VPLVFSPLSEAVLDSPPKALLPKHAFIMRQLGDPPDIDVTMTEAVIAVLNDHDVQTKDADASTGGKDFLERILGLIRSTGFTIAIFSHETRPTAMANIMLELGFAAMCGKPLVVVKSAEAAAPSDLKRTDWIDYAIDGEARFRVKLEQALNEIDDLETLLSVALEARSMDCAVAFERVNKGFLLSGDERFIVAAESILNRLKGADEGNPIADLERLRQEVGTFMIQARSALRG
jgi:hypothetical protein